MIMLSWVEKGNMFMETLYVEGSSSREGSYMSVLLKSAKSSSGLK